MSPRNRLFIPVLVIILFWAAPQARADENPPESAPSRNAVIRFYQDHLSAADGERCPMTPSCSQYAARAIKKHGPVIGWIMASDRLVRCGRDEVRLAPHVWIKGREYTHDPVSANDFWWFSKKEDTEKIPETTP